MSRTPEQRWQRATRYLAQRQVAAARTQLEAMQSLAPSHVLTQLLAARIDWHEGRPRDAASRALAAAQSAPDDADVLGDLIDMLLLVGEFAAAHGLLERPVWQHIEAPGTLLRYADLRRRFGEHAGSLEAFDRLVALRPDDPVLHHYRGQELQFTGRLEEAEAEYEACLALAPGYARAVYPLVRLRRQTRDDGRLGLIEAGLKLVRPGSREHADFEFARYHVLEDLGQTEAAWRALAAANAVMHAQAAHDAALEQQGLQRLCDEAEHRPPQAVATRHPPGPCPIFILGLPRSGTTVLERMLANHSQVASAGELMDFGRQLLRTGNTAASSDADFFARQLTLDFEEVGRGYLAQTRWRAGDKPYFIDKQPGNSMVAGLIHAALPEARILHLVRDPMDVCFSIWRARFGNTYAWSYDFGTLAAHYRLYRRMMAQWHATYPGAIMDVDYAELVRDPAATLRRVMEFCGLAWEAGCEDPTRNTSPVSTLSSAQVREPVHTRGLGQWRRYAEQLEPLRRELALPS